MKQAEAARKEAERAAKLTEAQQKAEAEKAEKLLQEFNGLRKAAGRSAYKA